MISASTRVSTGTAYLNVSRIILFILICLSAGQGMAQQAELGNRSGIRLNEFAPDGGKCSDACGPSCPDTCMQEPFQRCHQERTDLVVKGTRYTCGIHEACSIHDKCLSNCAIRYEYNLYYEKVDFFIGKCQRKCHLDALGYATKMTGSDRQGAEVVTSWARGHGPYQGTSIWEYTMQSPDSPENTKNCSPCGTCEDGKCKRITDNCPDCVACGDVHISTLDKLRYDFQAAGEFILMESDTGSHIVQIRTEPSGEYISLNTAVAMGVMSDQVAIHTMPEVRLVVNGAAETLADGETISLVHGGSVSRTSDIYRITWPDGSIVDARIRKGLFGYLDIGASMDAGLAGHMRGLAGDYDGSVDNEFKNRSGSQLAERLDNNTPYGTYADSWRIRQEESLFDYLEGESTATFTLLDFPKQHVDMNKFTTFELAIAESVCRKNNIVHPRLLKDCIYDVTVTGDVSFTESHWLSGDPEAAVPVDYITVEKNGEALVNYARNVAAGSRFTVNWSGVSLPDDYIAIVTVDTEGTKVINSRRVTKEGGLLLTAPDEPGSYEIRYVSQDLVVSSGALHVEAVTATLDSSEQTISGTQLPVWYSGPANEHDYIAVAGADMPGRKYHNFVDVDKGNPVFLRMPDAPGQYEVRYIQGQSKNILSRRLLTVK